MPHKPLKTWRLHARCGSKLMQTRTSSCMRVARVLGFADARMAAMGSARGSANVFNRERALAALHDQIGEDAVAELMALGAAMTQDEAVEEALAP